MKANEIMSVPVITTNSTSKLSSVKELFKKHNISSAPVVSESGEIEGIITSSDISAIYNEELTVRNVMTHKPFVYAINARVQDVAKKMLDENIHHIIVMDNGKIEGMISSLDVIRGLID